MRTLFPYIPLRGDYLVEDVASRSDADCRPDDRPVRPLHLKVRRHAISRGRRASAMVVSHLLSITARGNDSDGDSDSDNI